MARLVWDKVNERLYETGVDRCVLYTPRDPGRYETAIPWNGVVAVEEEFEDSEPESHYFDGLKYLDTYPIYDFKMHLTAFTYPDEFLEFEGYGSIGEGMYADDQPSKVFALTYRTMIGNSSDTPQQYKIHLLYNLTAIPEPVMNSTSQDTIAPLMFGWNLVSVPERAPGYRPTAHAIIDSRFLHPDLMRILEEALYGSDFQDAFGLPSLEDILDFLTTWNPRVIFPNETTGLATLMGEQQTDGDLAESYLPGLFYALPHTRLYETEDNGIYRLAEQSPPT